MRDGYDVVDLSTPAPASAAKFDVVVGCSGVRSFGHMQHHFTWLAPVAVLASASSANHEVGVDTLLGWHGLSSLPDTPPMSDLQVSCLNPEALTTRGVHHALTFSVEGTVSSGEPFATHVTVLNGGFPCTFIGRLNAVPPLLIQPTLCLMVGAAVRAAQDLDGVPRPAATKLPADAAYRDVLIPADDIDTWVQAQLAGLRE